MSGSARTTTTAVPTADACKPPTPGTSPGPIPRAGGRYGGLRDEVPEETWSGMSAK